VAQQSEPQSAPERFCRNCGTRLDPGASFCAQCGTSLEQDRTPGPAYATYAQVPNYLPQAILATLFCCLPLGIVAIVFAAQVNSRLAAGDYPGAVEASDKAKTWTWVTFWVGLGMTVIWVLFAVMVPLMAGLGAD
jgi:uncharacterized membrane protein YvbJ